MNEAQWLTVEQVAKFEGIHRIEVYRRMQPGDPQFLVWKDREDGKPGRLIDPGSMTFDAQRLYREERLRVTIEPAPTAAPPEQGNFFPELDRDKEAVPVVASESETQVLFRRLKIIQPTLNHDFAALGYTSVSAFRYAVAKETGIPESTQRRWADKYEGGGLEALLDDRPGPAKGIGRSLDASMKGYLQLRCLEGLTPQQCYRSLVEYLATKQNSPGCRVSYIYRFPSRPTVSRFLKSLGEIDKARREGPDALKATCGHIDRSYLDLAPLERVESDECKLNLFSYDPRRPVNRKGEPWIRRYWLLTFYDARSMYPLVWSLCEGSEYELRHGIAVEDEINLFTSLVREFGIPAAIHSDRGRFRGKDWGGEPYQQQIDKEFTPADGILQRVGQLAGFPEGVRHNMPRVHNPRGTRLERFHGWVADWFRGKPGWIGANTRERKMTRGDAEAATHKLWCVGKLARGERSPLLPRDEILAEVNKMMEAWREHNSEGTDMCGMTPRAVFVQNSPAAGFPQISEEQLALATAQHFENQRIDKGGIITLSDDARYSHPLLIDLAGQRREVVRLRHDHSSVTVLPAHKGEEPITAPRRVRVGAKNPDELARQMESQNHIINVSEFFAPQEGAPPTPETEISSVEYLMSRKREHREHRARMYNDDAAKAVMDALAEDAPHEEHNYDGL